MGYITILDYVLLPFYLGIVYAIAYRYRNKKYPVNHPWRRYFIPGLTVKIIGAVFIGLVYAYYYRSGDTFNYFGDAKIINSAFDESFSKWFNLLFRIPASNDGNYYTYTANMIFYNDPASYAVDSITAFVSIFTLNTYLPTAVIFAYISFSGVWALFRTFASLYPKLTRPVAIAVLFIPSTFVWGSGIFKDTICIFGLGWLTYSTFRFLVRRDFSVVNIILAVLSFILIAKIKLYILLGFAPALLIWILFNYSQNIRERAQKILVRFFSIILIIAGFLFFMERFGKDLGKYSLERIATTSTLTGNYI
ncbi:MAG TPA: hypothetical protein VET23_15215, partial [Chitinophagaceae bacterium]|nr:hypothetical protein [Chitinophagaceae bacterium]